MSSTRAAIEVEKKILQHIAPRRESTLRDYNVMMTIALGDASVEALYECMKTTEIPQVRQYCCFLLRKKIMSTRQWMEVSNRIRQGLKAAVLELLTKELDMEYVVNAISRLIATIAKHELRQKTWPELMQLLYNYIQSKNLKTKEVGLCTMSILTASAAADFLEEYLKRLLSLFSKTLVDKSSLKVQFLTIVCYTNIIYLIVSRELVNNFPEHFVPSILKIIQNLSKTDTIQACKAMRIFDTLISFNVAVIDSHVKPLTEFCFKLAVDQNLEKNIRIKALNILRWLIIVQNECVQKLNLISPLLNVLFTIMVQSEDDNDDVNKVLSYHFYEKDDYYFSLDRMDHISVSTMTNQVLRAMAGNFSPEELIPLLMNNHVNSALKSKNPQHRKAAYLALAAITNGFSKHIKEKCLPDYIKVVRQGIQDKNIIVANAAVYCFGRFAKHLQPDIDKYASDLIPLVLSYLQTACQFLKSNEDSPNLAKSFISLVVFCENLESEMIPKMTLLIEHLLSFLDTKSLLAKRLCVNTIESIICLRKGNFEEYFSIVIKHFQDFVCDKSSQETKESLSLIIQIMDSLETITWETFEEDQEFPQSLAHECVNLGIKLINKVNDPKLRHSVYTLFASMSEILKNNMKPHLTFIIERLIKSIISSEGIDARKESLKRDPSVALFENFDTTSEEGENDEEEYDDRNSSMDEEDDEYDFGDEDDDFEDEDEDDEWDYEDYYATEFPEGNPYMNEKESAFHSLQEISENSGQAFLPHLEYCFTTLFNHIESPLWVVRDNVINCLGKFCIILNQAVLETDSSNHRAELKKKQNMFFPALLNTARKDTKRHVVLTCLCMLRRMIDDIKNNFISDNMLISTVALIKDVFQVKLACQKSDGEKKLHFPESEYDDMLFEISADLIKSLIKSTEWKLFSSYFDDLFVFLISQINQATCVTYKSILIGALAEIVSEIEIGASQSFIRDLLPIFLEGMDHDSDEIRSNSVYGLGTLILNANEALFGLYPVIVEALKSMLAKEDNYHTQDNLGSTISKLIITNLTAVPLKEIFPDFLKLLPIKVDMKENIYIFRCLEHLFNLQSIVFLQNLPTILNILCTVLINQKTNGDIFTPRRIDDETKSIIVNLLKSIRQEFPQEFQSLLNKISIEHANILRTELDVVQ